MGDSTSKLQRDYADGIHKLAAQYASEERILQPNVQHFIRVIVEHLASVYVFNRNVSEKLNSLTIEIEALRRAVVGDIEKQPINNGNLPD